MALLPHLRGASGRACVRGHCICLAIETSSWHARDLIMSSVVPMPCCRCSIYPMDRWKMQPAWYQDNDANLAKTPCPYIRRYDTVCMVATIKMEGAAEAPTASRGQRTPTRKQEKKKKKTHCNISLHLTASPTTHTSSHKDPRGSNVGLTNPPHHRGVFPREPQRRGHVYFGISASNSNHSIRHPTRRRQDARQRQSPPRQPRYPPARIPASKDTRQQRCTQLRGLGASDMSSRWAPGLRSPGPLVGRVRCGCLLWVGGGGGRHHEGAPSAR
jgi:hypothetical protein